MTVWVLKNLSQKKFLPCSKLDLKLKKSGNAE